jgi:hypothetical protein
MDSKQLATLVAFSQARIKPMQSFSSKHSNQLARELKGPMLAEMVLIWVATKKKTGRIRPVKRLSRLGQASGEPEVTIILTINFY